MSGAHRRFDVWVTAEDDRDEVQFELVDQFRLQALSHDVRPPLLRTRKRRVLPSDVGPPVELGPPLTEMRSDIAWLERA